MYIILKGRITCEGNHVQYSDILMTKATIKDGEAFGEIAMVDHD